VAALMGEDYNAEVAKAGKPIQDVVGTPTQVAQNQPNLQPPAAVRIASSKSK
jgi:hypothetical protein